MAFQLPILGFAQDVARGVSGVGDAFRESERRRIADREQTSLTERQRQEAETRRKENERNARLTATEDRLPTLAQALTNVVEPTKDAEVSRTGQLDTLRAGLAGDLGERLTEADIRKMGAGSRNRILEAQAQGKIDSDILQSKLGSVLRLTQGLGDLETNQLDMVIGSQAALPQFLETSNSQQKNYLDAVERINQANRPSLIRQGMGPIATLGAGLI